MQMKTFQSRNSSLPKVSGRTALVSHEQFEQLMAKEPWFHHRSFLPLLGPSRGILVGDAAGNHRTNIWTASRPCSRTHECIYTRLRDGIPGPSEKTCKLAVHPSSEILAGFELPFLPSQGQPKTGVRELPKSTSNRSHEAKHWSLVERHSSQSPW